MSKIGYLKVIKELKKKPGKYTIILPVLYRVLAILSIGNLNQNKSHNQSLPRFAYQPRIEQ